jgi:hypothetical protein
MKARLLGPLAIVAALGAPGAFSGCDATESSSNSTGGLGGAMGSTGTSGGPANGGSATGGSSTERDGQALEGPVSTDAGICVAGNVSFHMSAAGGKTADYCVTTDCLGGWVSVRSMGGAALSLLQECTTTCDECIPTACRCIPAQTMKAQGETLAWKGTYWQPSTCKDAAACVNSRCLPPGKYIATMCASRRTSDAGGVDSCTSDAQPICTDVEFDYPSATVVEGVIPP